MKITTDVKPLKAALTTLSKVVRNSGPIPVLACVKLDPWEEGQEVRITGTDLGLWARIDLPTELEGIDPVLVNLKSLKEALKPLKKGMVELETIGETLSVGAAKLPLMPLEDYPTKPAIQAKVALGWPTGEVALRRAIVATTHDVSRYFLQAIQVTSTHLNSTDGHRMMRVDNPHPLEGDSFLVPLDMAKLTARVAKDELIAWAMDDNHIQAKVGPWEFLSKLPDCSFPDTNKVIPSNGSSLCCDRVELLEALTAILPFTQKESHAIKLAIGKGRIDLESTADNGNAKAHLAADVSGKPITIGFNAQYLIDPLRLSDAPSILFKWKDSKKAEEFPAELTAEDWRYIVMPQRT